MPISLIENCYKNDFGIDLKKHHREICNVSPQESELIRALNNNRRIKFDDGISSEFRLAIFDNLVYLVGNKSCYICSNVIQSAYGSEVNWVQCVVIPQNIIIQGETDIRKSGIIVSLFTELIAQIPEEILFFEFLNKMTYAFSQCGWFKRIYSLSNYVKAVKFWSYKQKITQLYQLGLLYPLEFSVLTIYQDLKIKNEYILKYFIASLAESTNKIFSIEEVTSIFKKLSENEIQVILALNELTEIVYFEKLTDESFADLLNIDIGERYPTIVDGVYNWDYARRRADSLFKTSSYKSDYYNKLKKNFRALENKIRAGKGYQHVGSYFTEKLLFDKLQQAFPQLTIKTQYSPLWLRPQRLDIYVSECRLGIEYHGAQHYLPIDFFGGKDGLLLRQQLDQTKREKCIKNGIDLLEITYEEDFDFAFANAKSFIIEILNRLVND